MGLQLFSVFACKCLMRKTLTCFLKSIFSFLDFLVKLDKNDKGKTKAALPIKTNPNKMELSLREISGLQYMEKFHRHRIPLIT